MRLDERWLHIFCTRSGRELDMALRAAMQDTTEERALLRQKREQLIESWRKLLPVLRKTGHRVWLICV